MVVQQSLIPRAVGSSPICSAKHFYWEVSSIGKSRGLINLWLQVQVPCFPFITYKVFEECFRLDVYIDRYIIGSIANIEVAAHLTSVPQPYF